MISRFQFRTPVTARGSPSPTARPASGAAAGSVHPLTFLLRDLRGRTVTLLVGGQLITGRIVTFDPLILVGPSGEAFAVAADQVQQVQF